MLVDSHAHLDSKQFDSDREAVLRRAREAGVATVLTIGTGDGPGTLDCAIRVVEAFDGRPEMPCLFATVGIHPHEAARVRASDYAELEQLAQHPSVVAWGEIGLDYFYEHAPRGVQRDVFVQQIELAEAARLPIVIHCRPSRNSADAWDDTLALLRQHWRRTGLGGVLHCFSGGPEQARQGLDCGFLLSFSGNVTFPKAEEIREAARIAPLDRMMVETDCPYLAPTPLRGKRNEPAFVSHTAARVAELRGLVPEELALRTAENFTALFPRTRAGTV